MKVIEYWHGTIEHYRYGEDASMGSGGPPGGPRGRGRAQGVAHAPTLVDGGWPPSGSSFAQYFLYILKIIPVEFQDFWRCAE